MIINRYLTREVLTNAFTVTFVLLLAFICQQSVRYLNYAAVGKIAVNLLLKLIGFEVPYLSALLLPLGLYLGLLLGYGRMHADNEMAILQLCGFGNRQLAKVTLKIAFGMTLFVLFLMLVVNPLISAKRQMLLASDEATLHLIRTLVPGRFQASPDGRQVMYVEKISRNHMKAKNVFLAQKKMTKLPQNTWMLVHAAEGYQQKGKQRANQYFVTTNGFRYDGTPGENDFQIIQFGRYEVRLPVAASRNTHDESEGLSTFKLWQLYANPKHAAELQWRISIGILTFLLALSAIPLSTARPRQSRYAALLPAILFYIIYINLLFIARHWVEQGAVPIFLGMWWVHGIILAFILSLFLIKSHWINWSKRS